MKKQISSFNEKLYKKAKKELISKKVQKIISDYIKKYKLKKLDKYFLSYYYSPTLAALNQFIEKTKGKSFLEIGFRIPLFLEYLKQGGAKVYGIDIDPYILNQDYLKESIEKPSKKFIRKYKNKFHVIFARITLSKLYDESHYLKTGKYMFRNKKKILSNIHKLLKSKGLLILQDDRGSIFTDSQFAKLGFKKVMKETPIIFKDKKGNDLGWNVLVVYKKV